jgi:hypothetical protein
MNSKSAAGIDRIMRNIKGLAGKRIGGQWQDLVENIKHKWPDAYMDWWIAQEVEA